MECQKCDMPMHLFIQHIMQIQTKHLLMRYFCFIRWLVEALQLTQRTAVMFTCMCKYLQQQQQQQQISLGIWYLVFHMYYCPGLIVYKIGELSWVTHFPTTKKFTKHKPFDHMRIAHYISQFRLVLFERLRVRLYVLIQRKFYQIN